MRRRNTAVGLCAAFAYAARTNASQHITAQYSSSAAAVAALTLSAVIGIGGYGAARADDLPPPIPTKAPAMPAMAMGGSGEHGGGHDGGVHGTIPAGVHGAAMVPAGKFMFSYTPSFMHMTGNYIGSNQVSGDTIVTTVHTPPGTMMGGMMAPFYRIVPQSMETDMHMFHAMYGVTDWFNLMVMANYTYKTMTMTTYAGMMGTKVLGSSTASTEGFGDTAVMSLWRLYDDGVHHVHVNLGLWLPSGSDTQSISMLSPMGMSMNMRANYGMQLGTGTVDLAPGVTYTGRWKQWSWGAVYRGRYALDTNVEGYSYGSWNDLTGWAGYTWIPGVTTTFRADGTIWGPIRGSDPAIMGVMQGTNPAFYGGQRINLFGGLELNGAPVGLRNVNLAVEGGAPVYQYLNGPQLGMDWQVNVALRIGL
jgi:hypothetical protein